MKNKAILFLGLFLLCAKAEASMQFVASSSITINDSPLLDNTTNLTLSAWIYPTTIVGGSAYVFISKRETSSSNISYMLFINNASKISFDVGFPTSPFMGSFARMASNQSVFVNNWYHIVAVFDGSLGDPNRMKIYINGVLDGATIAAPPYITDTNSKLFIGNGGGTNAAFVGYVDDVRIYIGRSFTQEDVTYFNNCRCRPNDTDYLTFYAPLNTGKDGAAAINDIVPNFDMGQNRFTAYGATTSPTWYSISPLTIPGGD